MVWRWRKSGWLNEDAACREPEAGARAICVCFGRTLNMSLMSVTLDVLKLSGWLNASAPCVESKGSQ